MILSKPGKALFLCYLLITIRPESIFSKRFSLKYQFFECFLLHLKNSIELRKDTYVNKKLTLLSDNYSFFQRRTTFWDFPIIFSRPGSFPSDCQYIIKKQKSLDLKLNQEILGGCDCDARWVLTHLQNL